MTADSTTAPVDTAGVLEALTRLGGGAIVVFDAAGIVTSVTGSAADLFGGDLAGRPVTDFWPPEAVAHVLVGEVVPEAMEVGSHGRRTTQAAPLRAADGRVVGGVIRARAVAPEPTARQAYPEASEQVLRVFHASALPTCITDASGRHLLVNNAFCELLGRTEEELLSLGTLDTAPPEDASANRAALDRLQSQQVSIVRTKRLLRADGTVLWAEVCTTPVVAPETGALELIVQMRDVTQAVMDRHELLEQQRRLDASQEAGRVGTWEIDLGARTASWSRHNYKLHLLEPSDRPPSVAELAERIPEADREAMTAMFRATVGRRGEYDIEQDYRIVADDGTERVLQARGRHTPAPDGGPGIIRGTTVDVTEERARVRALEIAEERFRRAFDTSMLGLVVIGPDGTALQVNEAFCRMVGYSPEQLVGGRSAEITHPEDVDAHRAAERRLRSGQSDFYVVQKRYRHADGHYIWVETSAAPMGEDRDELVVQIRDITESRRQQQKLQFLADHDPLTGVLNRRAFDREVVSHLGRVLDAPHHHAGALLVLDLDNFKQQNDAFGHAFGDALLVAVAGAIKSQVGTKDAVARIGGDEFAVLLTRASGSEAAETAKQVLEAIGRAVDDLPGDPDSPVGASLGMAIPHADDGLDTLLQRADARMYEMKAARSRRTGLGH